MSLTEDIVNDTIHIPAWWHDCSTGVDQQFDSMKEVRLALIYYIAKKFVWFCEDYEKRITVKCSKKKKTGCAWRLHASLMTHTTRFAIKTFNYVTRVVEKWVLIGIRAFRKWVSDILQSVLKHWSTHTPYDTQKDFKAQFRVTLTYDKIWWGKELAQNDLHGLTRHSYDSLR